MAAGDESIARKFWPIKVENSSAERNIPDKPVGRLTGARDEGRSRLWRKLATTPRLALADQDSEEGDGLTTLRQFADRAVGAIADPLRDEAGPDVEEALLSLPPPEDRPPRRSCLEPEPPRRMTSGSAVRVWRSGTAAVNSEH